MATVKGDVHDIGKNIVGVVLACNNYEVIDLGVMVPVQRILETARESGADLIGLSGLITPSLEEMRHVAGEMEREGFELPLLIGGATTSRTHTAVKIEPQLPRAGGPRRRRVARGRGRRRRSSTPSGARRSRPASATSTRRVRRERGAREEKIARHPIAEARRHRLAIDWTARRAAAPVVPRRCGPSTTTRSTTSSSASTGRRSSRPGSSTGSTRRILSDPVVGHGRHAPCTTTRSPCSSGSSRERRLQARGRRRLLAGQQRRRRHRALHRRSADRPRRHDPHAAPADGQAAGPPEPGARRLHGAARDGHRRLRRRPSRSRPGTASRTLVAEAKAAHDDYTAILASALADRLAEAFAERLHELVRRELWGYAADEALTNDDLIAERYQGIRPAPGYPACPDHTEKGPLFELLDAEARAGIELTESFAMWPGASVSGYYFWHPEAAYFGLGRIGHDQLEDYAHRKGMAVDDAARWLGPEPCRRLTGPSSGKPIGPFRRIVGRCRRCPGSVAASSPASSPARWRWPSRPPRRPWRPGTTRSISADGRTSWRRPTSSSASGRARR